MTNGNANESISVNHATFGDKDIRRTSNTYDSSANIGPLQTRSFVFSITTDAREGWYYPCFSLSLRDAPENLYYITPVRVENTPVVTTITSQPDTFTRDQKDPITIQIANPRENDVKNAVLEVTGDGITATPSKIYIGSLTSGTTTNRTVAINPTKETTLRVSLSYDNGDNSHTDGTDLPVTFGTNKKKADLVISNVKVTSDGSVFHVTGDVTNAGLTTANGVSVTSLFPAVPKDPYASYVVGVLKPDDFGSFEVTFAADGITSVPFQVTHKDLDGNVIHSSPRDISISSTGSSGTSGKPIDSPLPVLVIGFITVLVIAGGYLYVKRKKSQ
ncbi:hypothetical protein [Methanoregula sp.]|uniref:hypothetical protein n=1 Tax=Methanoregula sp. TaxID=2052170 RepID=UPI0025DEF22A|nr:hypothetical protein [Methanoregula sp.]